MYPNLRAEQARAGMTNAQVANFLGLSRVAYEQKLRSGRFVVSESLKLCQLFKSDFEYLFSQTPIYSNAVEVASNAKNEGNNK